MNSEKRVQKLKEIIDPLIGKTFLYGAKNHTLESYLINEQEEKVKIQTDIRFYERGFDSIESFIDQLEPVKEISVIKADKHKEVFLPAMQVNSDVIRQLKDVLLDNIEKVKNDKEYIPQASAVKENVDGIIDLAKIELGYITSYVNARKGQ
jgi:hypothetical protein